jgi:hypothetical protein
MHNESLVQTKNEQRVKNLLDGDWIYEIIECDHVMIGILIV